LEANTLISMTGGKNLLTLSSAASRLGSLVLFFHCERCCEEEQQYPGDKSVGTPATANWWCEIHNCRIGEWELKDPPNYTCDECGKTA
jgi:hypothetical protein